jgi:transcriptional regulator with XRE-family HTH domain
LAADGERQAHARVCRLLRELRLAAGLTQDAVAADLGCTPCDVADMEAGRADVPPELWPVLAEIFDVPPEVFLQDALGTETATYADLVAALDRTASPRVRRAVQNLLAALAAGGDGR